MAPYRHHTKARYTSTSDSSYPSFRTHCDPISGTWDKELIQDIFWDEDVTNIIATLVKPDMEDCLAWHADTRGIFSVESAYHILIDEKARQHICQAGEKLK